MDNTLRPMTLIPTLTPTLHVAIIILLCGPAAVIPTSHNEDHNVLHVGHQTSHAKRGHDDPRDIIAHEDSSPSSPSSSSSPSPQVSRAQPSDVAERSATLAAPGYHSGNNHHHHLHFLPDEAEKDAGFRESLESPWETALFQWMEDPTLTHLPLSNYDAHGRQKEEDDSEVYGKGLSVGRTSAQNRRRLPEGETPDLDISPTLSPPASRGRGGSVRRVWGGKTSKTNNRGRTQQRRKRKRLSSRYRQRHLNKRRRVAGNDTGGQVALSGGVFAEHEFRTHKHENIAADSDINESSQPGLPAYADRRDTDSRRLPSRRNKGRVRQQRRHRDSRQEPRDTHDGLRSSSSSPSLPSSINSLPHVADQIVLKLPSDTSFSSQRSSLILSGSPVRRTQAAASTEFVTLSRLSHNNKNNDDNGDDDYDDDFDDNTNKDSGRIESDADSINSGGVNEHSPSISGSRARRPGRKRNPRVSTVISHHKLNATVAAMTPRPTRQQQASSDSLTFGNVRMRHTNEDMKRVLGSTTPSTKLSQYKGELIPVVTTFDPPRRGFSNPEEKEEREQSCACRAHLERCYQTEHELQMLRQTYQRNLEALRLLLVEALDHVITDPSHTLKDTLCKTHDVPPPSAPSQPRHEDQGTPRRNIVDDVKRNDDDVKRGGSSDQRVKLGEEQAERSDEHTHRSQEIGEEKTYDPSSDSQGPLSLGRNSDLVGVTSILVDRRSNQLPSATQEPADDVPDEGQDAILIGVANNSDKEDTAGNAMEDGQIRPSSSGRETGSDQVDSAYHMDINHGEGRNLDFGDDDDGISLQQAWESWQQKQHAKREEAGKRGEAERGEEEEEGSLALKTHNCTLGQWSEWTGPVGFGVIERRRTLLSENEECQQPEVQNSLVMRVDVSVFTENRTYYKPPEKVAKDFEADFTRSVVPRDLLLVLDASGSITEDDFELMRAGVDVMVRLFCGGFGPNSTNNRLAIVLFASRMYIIHRFSDDQSQETLRDVIANLSQPNGNTCTGDALQLAHDVIFSPANGARNDVVWDTLLVTDGHSNCGEVTIQEGAQLLRNVSNLFALGVGVANDTEARSELNSVVSNNDPRHIFSLARFQDFKEMLDGVEDRRKTLPCLPIIDASSASEREDMDEA